MPGLVPYQCQRTEEVWIFAEVGDPVQALLASSSLAGPLGPSRHRLVWGSATCEVLWLGGFSGVGRLS